MNISDFSLQTLNKYRSKITKVLPEFVAEIYLKILEKCIEKGDNHLTGKELEDILEDTHMDYPAFREHLAFEFGFLIATELVSFTYEDEEHEENEEPNGLDVDFELIEGIVKGTHHFTPAFVKRCAIIGECADTMRQAAYEVAELAPKWHSQWGSY